MTLTFSLCGQRHLQGGFGRTRLKIFCLPESVGESLLIFIHLLYSILNGSLLLTGCKQHARCFCKVKAINWTNHSCCPSSLRQFFAFAIISLIKKKDCCSPRKWRKILRERFGERRKKKKKERFKKLPLSFFFLLLHWNLTLSFQWGFFPIYVSIKIWFV